MNGTFLCTSCNIIYLMNIIQDNFLELYKVLARSRKFAFATFVQTKAC